MGDSYREELQKTKKGRNAGTVRSRGSPERTEAAARSALRAQYFGKSLAGRRAIRAKKADQTAFPW